MNFLLLNKDIPVLTFCISRDMGFLDIRVTNVFDDSIIPLSIRKGTSFQDWLNSRLILSHRRNVTAFFKSIGVYNTEDILCCTNAISLLDTYWVKEERSNLSWKSVSPYSNPLNETVSYFSFSGRINGKNIASSPDFATSGNFPKCWKKINGDIYLYKAGSQGAFNAGKEPYSEFFASELAKKLEIDSVEYDLSEYHGKIVTRCKNFCTEEIGMYAISEVFPEISKYTDLFSLSVGDISGDVQDKKIVDMLLLDFLSLNTDRHFSNIGVRVNNKTQALCGFATIYDYNLSFMPYYAKGSMSIEDTISDKSNDVYLYCKDDTPFDDIIPLLLKHSPSGYIKHKIDSLRGFRFKSTVNRSDIANEILDRQVRIAEKYL